jgi:hypothetical protein
LIRETTENESANEGYRFGQEEETYNIVAAHGYFGRLIFQYAIREKDKTQVSSSWDWLFPEIQVNNQSPNKKILSQSPLHSSHGRSHCSASETIS